MQNRRVQRLKGSWLNDKSKTIFKNTSFFPPFAPLCFCAIVPLCHCAIVPLRLRAVSYPVLPEEISKSVCGTEDGHHSYETTQREYCHAT